MNESVYESTPKNLICIKNRLVKITVFTGVLYKKTTIKITLK